METQSQASSAAEKKKRVETIVAAKGSAARHDISEKAVASSTTSNGTRPQNRTPGPRGGGREGKSGRVEFTRFGGKIALQSRRTVRERHADGGLADASLTGTVRNMKLEHDYSSWKRVNTNF